MEVLAARATILLPRRMSVPHPAARWLGMVIPLAAAGARYSTEGAARTAAVVALLEALFAVIEDRLAGRERRRRQGRWRGWRPRWLRVAWARGARESVSFNRCARACERRQRWQRGRQRRRSSSAADGEGARKRAGPAQSAREVADSQGVRWQGGSARSRGRATSLVRCWEGSMGRVPPGKVRAPGREGACR